MGSRPPRSIFYGCVLATSTTRAISDSGWPRRAQDFELDRGVNLQSLRNEARNASYEDSAEQPADNDLKPEVIAQGSPAYPDRATKHHEFSRGVGIRPPVVFLVEIHERQEHIQRVKQGMEFLVGFSKGACRQSLNVIGHESAAVRANHSASTIAIRSRFPETL